MGKFQIKIDKANGEFRINVGGVIDEDVDFSTHSLAGATKIEIFLAQVKSINSCGIREWIKWIATSGPAQVTYVECPKIIVDQINMVQGFLPVTGKVMSFYVPFYNDDSGAEKSILFKFGEHFSEAGLGKVPEVKDEDGNAMEMDVVEAKYFKFLKK